MFGPAHPAAEKAGPCPFCEARAVQIDASEGCVSTGGWAKMRCLVCGAMGPDAEAETLDAAAEEAVRLWSLARPPRRSFGISLSSFLFRKRSTT